MNVVTHIDNFNIYNLFFNEKVNNTVIENSHFIRINYSNDLLSLTGIYIDIYLNITEIDKYYNKYKYNFSLSNNHAIISKLIELEKTILKSQIFDKFIKTYKLKEQLLSLNIKTFQNNPYYEDNTLNFILKISGVWITSTQCGLTFKFLTPESIC